MKSPEPFHSLPTTFIAQTSDQPTNSQLTPEAYRDISSLTLFVAIIGVLAGITLGLVITTKRAHRRKARAPKSTPTTHTDAWTESGKRFDPSITEIDPTKDE